MIMSQSSTPHVTKPPNTRPFGLRVIIALFWVKSLAFIGFLIFLLVAAYGTQTGMEALRTLLMQMPMTLASFTITTPLNVMVAIGLWRRKRWAWTLTMAILAYAMAQDIMSYWDGQPIYLSMALNVIQVGYLNQKEVQDLFGKVAREA